MKDEIISRKLTDLPDEYLEKIEECDDYIRNFLKRTCEKYPIDITLMLLNRNLAYVIAGALLFDKEVLKRDFLEHEVLLYKINLEKYSGLKLNCNFDEKKL